MEQELKQKWINALKSGKYTQTKGQLKDEIGYCCLGVLAEVANLPITENGLGIKCADKKENGGWKPLCDIINDEKKFSRLWLMNDTEDQSFVQIADYIEKNL